MLQVICPLDQTVHHADDIHAGKMLRCAKCGRPVQIPSASPEASRSKLSKADEGGEVKIPGRGWRSRTPSWASGIAKRLKRNSMATSLAAWLLTVSVALLALGFYFRQNPVDASPTPTALHQRTPAASDPWTSSPRAEPEQHRTLLSGTRIRPDIEDYGKGILTIDNTGGQDAEVKVISDSDRRVVRDVFVHQGTTFRSAYIREGSYRVQFAVGDDWDSAVKHFSRDQSFFEFGSGLDFKETQTDEGIEYTEHTITLYTRPDGNVRSEVISEQTFEGQ